MENTNEEIVDIRLTQGTPFEYSSAEGLLYKTDTREPLSLLTSNVGQRVLDSMFVKKKFVPSILEDGAVKIRKEKSNPIITEDPKTTTEGNIETTVITKIVTINDIETTVTYSLLITIKNTKDDGSEISLVDNDGKSKITVYRQDKCLIPMAGGVN